jgi:hypothetical protein
MTEILLFRFRFSFLLRIPITFSTYLVPIAGTGRELSTSRVVADELADLFAKILDLLSCAVKNVEDFVLGADGRDVRPKCLPDD